MTAPALVAAADRIAEPTVTDPRGEGAVVPRHGRAAEAHRRADRRTARHVGDRAPVRRRTTAALPPAGRNVLPARRPGNRLARRTRGRRRARARSRRTTPPAPQSCRLGSPPTGAAAASAQWRTRPAAHHTPSGSSPTRRACSSPRPRPGSRTWSEPSPSRPAGPGCSPRPTDHACRPRVSPRSSASTAWCGTARLLRRSALDPVPDEPRTPRCILRFFRRK